MDDMGSEDMDQAGGDCQSTGTCAGGPAASIPINIVTPSVLQQSILAAQQFGVIVGVALLVGTLFLLMIAIELCLDWLEKKCCKLLGKKIIKEAPDPASLVGSFKRYK